MCRFLAAAPLVVLWVVRHPEASLHSQLQTAVQESARRGLIEPTAPDLFVRRQRAWAVPQAAEPHWIQENLSESQSPPKA